MKFGHRAVLATRTSHRAAVNSDAVPKDLDRMIDAALDRGTDILRDDARHRAPMQVTADRVEKTHGRVLRIVEADQATLAPDRQQDPDRGCKRLCAEQRAARS